MHVRLSSHGLSAGETLWDWWATAPADPSQSPAFKPLPGPAAPLTREQMTVPGNWTPDIMRAISLLPGPPALPTTDHGTAMVAAAGLVAITGLLWWNFSQASRHRKSERERKGRERQRRSAIMAALET